MVKVTKLNPQTAVDAPVTLIQYWYANHNSVVPVCLRELESLVV